MLRVYTPPFPEKVDSTHRLFARRWLQSGLGVH